MPETREEFVTRIQGEWQSAETGAHAEPDSLRCGRCGNALTEENAVHHDDRILCKTCFDFRYGTCHFCGAIERKNQMQRGEVDDEDGCREIVYRCNSCGDEHVPCNDCNLFISTDERDDNHGVCASCEENYVTCTNCGYHAREDNMHDLHGDYYCDSCYNERTNVVHSYSYRPSPVFLPDEDQPWYYGIESEHDNDDDSDEDERDEAAVELNDIANGMFYLKHDGSLNCGYEIVTHPCTLDYQLNVMPWEKIAKIALSHGMRSHETDTAGLHVHVSRTRFGDEQMEQDLNIAKVMLLFDLFWETKVIPFSRRKRGRLDQWAKRPGIGLEQDDTATIAIKKSKQSIQCGDRYTAINLMNNKTVEFRIFRGTLKAKTIKATLQWIETLIAYAIDTNLRDIWKSDWEEIFAGTEYPELKEYLVNRHLLEGDE